MAERRIVITDYSLEPNPAIEVLANLIQDIDAARSEAAHDPSVHGHYFEPFKELAERISVVLYDRANGDYYEAARLMIADAADPPAEESANG